MILMQGKEASTGVTKGTLYFYKRPDTTVVKAAVEDPGAERERLYAARQASMEQLEAPAEKARAADVSDVTRRILNNFMGIVDGGIDSEEPVILADDDLAPSETLQLDKTKILGFATQGGSGNSHTAILARTMGIPAVCGLGDRLKEEYAGRLTYIDGETGQLVIEPDELTLTAFADKQVDYFNLNKEENPAMGVSGRFFSLSHSDSRHSFPLERQ